LPVGPLDDPGCVPSDALSDGGVIFFPVSPMVWVFRVDPAVDVEVLASFGLPGVVLFSVVPPVPGGLFCCAIATVIGSASKPAANRMEREIECITAFPFRLLSIKRSSSGCAPQHHENSIVSLPFPHCKRQGLFSHKWPNKEIFLDNTRRPA
jgi:hypothetical protein